MRNEFEQYLQHSLDTVPEGKVKEAALYSLMNGGKRIRPQLLFAVLESYRIQPRKGFAAACAIEMMHTYSLIHDDLPSMDNDTLRRGKPTCHVAFGEGVAILAGDSLLTHCFAYANEASDNAMITTKIVKEMATNGGLNGMIYGQELDIQNEENQDIDAATLEKIHHYKTGKLISLACVVGAYLCEKDSDVETWREIGHIIGLLFQIQDDVLDVTQTSEVLGKNANSDAENNKTTYVTLLGVDKCNEAIEELYEKALSLLKTMNIDEEPMHKVFSFLLHRKY